MERFEAIVIGAGPAGSTAAYHLASAGVSTLLLDKARFPRDKPCGGGLTGRAVRLLPFSVDPVVEDVVDRFEFRLDYRRRFVRRGAATLVLMTQRLRLDAFLAEQAVKAGADFRDGVKASGVSVDEEEVRVTVDGSPVRAAVLIGADGVNGVTARSVGLGGDYTYGVALEGNVPYGRVPEQRYRGVAVIELGTVPGGYGWVFAKGDHVNVGVGGWESEGSRLRAHLRRLCREHGVGEEAVEGLRGYRLPLRQPRSGLVQGRVALIGDAAGLVDPLSGDGISEAFLSAKLVSEAVLDLLTGREDSLAPYGPALARALNQPAAASWAAKRAVDRFPRLTFAIARLPIAWKVVDALLRGELSHPGEVRGLPRVPMRALQALARLAGDPGTAYRPEPTG